MNTAPVHPTQELHFRKAEADNVKQIVDLVNSAYRGDSSRLGWTTEADLLGGQRTDVDEILSLITHANSLILLCFSDNQLVGSVHLENIGYSTVYLGMLVIKPVCQGRGIGNRFLSEAEQLAKLQWGAKKIQMQVISLRCELIEFYKRRGYQGTGEFRPFPASQPRFGLPKVSGLILAVMEKPLD